MVTRVLSCLLASALLATSLVTPTTAAAASLPSPSSFSSPAQSSSAVAVRWAAVKGAAGYRVDWSATANFASANSAATTRTNAELNGLSAASTYYVRVVAKDSAGNAGTRSATLKVATAPKGGPALLPPIGIQAERSTTSLTFTWTARAKASGYQLQYAMSPSFAKATTRNVSGTSLRVTTLPANRTHYVRVRALVSGKPASQYSPTLKTSTKKYPYGTLTGLRSAESTVDAAVLTWSGKAGATRYRVRIAASKAMKNAAVSYATATRAEIKGLKRATDYYAQVRVVDDQLDALNDYSPAVKVTTQKAGGYSHLAPVGLRVTSVGSSTVGLSWSPRGAGLRYDLRRAADTAALSSARTVTATSHEATGLKPSTAYRFTVRVVDSTGKPLSRDSDVVRATTEPASKASIRVASYNVRCHYCSNTPAANELPWTRRREAVVATILSQYPDVVGIQEASQTRLIGSDGKAEKDSQFDDLVKRLGAPYKITNPYRYNCVNGYSASKCKAKSRGASKGTKIVYNSKTVTLVSHGTQRLTSPKGKYRYAVWGIFTDKATKKSFFFINTHLEWEKDIAPSTTYYDLRVAQARDLVKVIADKSRGLPVVVAGDFNTSKRTLPDNAPYDILQAAGYLDPLGNGYDSTTPAPTAFVQKRIHTNYNSFNGFRLDPPRSSQVNGSYVDYLFTSARVAVSEWETVVKLDATGRFDGVIPSDHNLIRATVVLP